MTNSPLMMLDQSERIPRRRSLFPCSLNSMRTDEVWKSLPNNMKLKANQTLPFNPTTDILSSRPVVIAVSSHDVYTDTPQDQSPAKVDHLYGSPVRLEKKRSAPSTFLGPPGKKPNLAESCSYNGRPRDERFAPALSHPASPTPSGQGHVRFHPDDPRRQMDFHRDSMHRCPPTRSEQDNVYGPGGGGHSLIDQAIADHKHSLHFSNLRFWIHISVLEQFLISRIPVAQRFAFMNVMDIQFTSSYQALVHFPAGWMAELCWDVLTDKGRSCLVRPEIRPGICLHCNKVNKNGIVHPNLSWCRTNAVSVAVEETEQQVEHAEEKLLEDDAQTPEVVPATSTVPQEDKKTTEMTPTIPSKDASSVKSQAQEKASEEVAPSVGTEHTIRNNVTTTRTVTLKIKMGKSTRKKRLVATIAVANLPLGISNDLSRNTFGHWQNMQETSKNVFFASPSKLEAIDCNSMLSPLKEETRPATPMSSPAVLRSTTPKQKQIIRKLQTDNEELEHRLLAMEREKAELERNLEEAQNLLDLQDGFEAACGL